MVRDTSGDLEVPSHAAAERFWRARGYLAEKMNRELSCFSRAVLAFNRLVGIGSWYLGRGGLM
jgi:hypothetical protein